MDSPVSKPTPLVTLRRAALLIELVSLSALAAACAVDPAGSASRVEQALAGVDGARTVNAANTVVNQYTPLAATAAANATSIQVGSVAALANGADALAAGDLLLIMQMQGAILNTASATSTWGEVTSLGNAGRYELVEVSAVDAGTNTITLSCGLRNPYTATGNVQVVRVPQYTTLTVAAGASIVAPAWNGSVGGVVAVHAASTVTLNGDINVSARGFRGGPADNASGNSAVDVPIFSSASDTDGARKGEGIGGLVTQFGRAPAANGGGGGNSHNGGGGGGANARSGGAWTGQGVFDTTVKGGALAWPLDPNFSAVGSEGGGRGGYTYSANDINALTKAPGLAAWGGNSRRERGGLGGHPVDNAAATRLFMGGGGGAGDGNNQHAGRGGNGGGIAVVIAGSVTGTGRILANGEAGVDSNSVATAPANGDSPGGGGGGGTVVVRAGTASGFTVQARGGVGGDQIVDNGDEAEGPGGGGGGGYVAISANVTADVAGGTGGTTDADPVAEFPSNGATSGSPGKALFGAGNTNVPICVDSGVPETSIESAPDDPTNDPTGTFEFGSDDPAATFECRVDSDPFAPCPATFTTDELADGPHTIEVRARDRVGNVDATPAQATWVVDTTPPDTTIESGPRDPTPETDAEFTFSSNETNVTFECSLDGGAFSLCPTPLVLTELAAGPHTMSVRAVDAAGNVDATPDDYSWEVTPDDDGDGDGIPDDDEPDAGTDPNDADTDDDGLIDGREPSPGEDSDGDGLTNGRDPDSDDDGIFDGTESGVTTPHADTDATRGRFVPDADDSTTTDPLDPDTDGGSVRDGVEDPNHDGAIDAGERDPNDPSDDVPEPDDTDGDGLSDDEEDGLGTDPNDADTDDDGLIDGDEPNPSDDSDGDGDINPLDPDSDDDGIRDGTETGKNCDLPATAAGDTCVPDGDGGRTTTSPLDPDTDDGGVSDGDEDTNGDGVVDDGERDPNDPSDDDSTPGEGGAGGTSGAGGGGRAGGAGRGGSASDDLPVVLGGGLCAYRPPRANGAAFLLVAGAVLGALARRRRRR